MSPVIDHLARPGDRTCLQEIYSQTLAAEDTEVGPYTIVMEVSDATLSYVILRKAGDELDIHSIIGQRDRHIGLTSTECGVKLFCLGETEVTWRR